MNKKILALAVAAAVSAPAMAQNVSVYGIIDTGFQNYDNGTSSFTRANDGAFSTSRLGFNGTEDLGGGLKASFKLEARLNPSAGTNGSALFNRGANVTLSGGFGAVSLGMNDVSDNQDIESMVSQAGNFALRPSITNNASVAVTSGELGSDVANVIRYKSPSFSGFQAEVGFGSGNAAGKVADANADYTDFNVRYTNGPLMVIYGSSKLSDSTAASETTFSALGASYDFGFAKVGYSKSSADVNFATGKVGTQVLSASMPVGNGMTAFAAYGSAEVKALASGKGSGSVIGLKKDLSKRTSLYGAYTSASAQSAAGFTFGGVTFTTGTTGLGTDQKAITVGITHSF